MIANDLERIKFLVGKGADVNKQDNQGYTPLTNAARQRQDETVKLLISLKADANLVDGNAMTPLIAATMRDHVPSVKVLLDGGANIEKPGPEDFRPLALALAENKYEAAKALMEAGADPSVAVRRDGLTPLMIAAAQSLAGRRRACSCPAARGRSIIAQGLIERKADVNAKSTTGMTAADDRRRA